MKKIILSLIRFFYRCGPKQIVLMVNNHIIKKNMTNCIKKTRKKIEKGKKVNVVFIVQFPEMWNSLSSVYEAIKKDNAFNVFVVAFPKRGSDASFSFEEKNDAFNFCKQKGIDAVDGFENKKIFLLKTFQPDYVFVQRPYDPFLPKKYSLKNISKKSLICYIPYSGRMTKGIHLSIEFDRIVKYFYILFADCSDAKAYVMDKIKNNSYRKIQKVYDVGFPRFDLINKKQNDGNVIKKVLWMPRWSTSSSNNRSYFYDYLETIISAFSVHCDLNLIIRPHPLMFSNFIKTGFKTKEDIDKLMLRINCIPNISFDNNANYLDTFDNVDLLLSDATSLLLEFFFTNKPVILFDNIEPLTDDCSKIVSTFYRCNNPKHFIDIFERLLRGDDSKKEKREKTIEDLYPSDGSVSNKIVAIIKNDLENRGAKL